ncbi:MAG: transcriptional regulator [Proteobacteria bacterium]|nr:MAG: transcriptional regulator [Pseudomonadota bacterium]PIE17818.1 MAG: transcriptional regulator [Pseudomonadota bacterium]
MTNSRRTLVVANPQSAGGSLAKRWEGLAPSLEAQIGPFDHLFTSGVGDAPRLVRDALQGGYERIIAFGGDGTVSEVIDGFFHETTGKTLASNAVLAVLPFGTGGDFRRSIGASKKLEFAIDGLASAEVRRLDIGRLSYRDRDDRPAQRHFANIASFGMSGLVSAFVNESGKRLGGKVSFALATLKAMRRYQPQRALLTLDDRPPREATFHVCGVCNGQYFGGGMWMAPDASLEDGLFDVVTLAPMSLKDVLLRGNRLYKGTHVDLPQTTVERARRVVAEPLPGEAPILLDVDGETPGHLPATFELLPGALRVQVPQLAPPRGSR